MENKSWHATRHHLAISPRHRPNGRVHAYERSLRKMKRILLSLVVAFVVAAVGIVLTVGLAEVEGRRTSMDPSGAADFFPLKC